MYLTSRLAAVAFAAATLGASFSTQVQAQSVGVNVNGNISPGSCTARILSGDVVDFGRVLASSLKQTEINWLETRSVVYTIQCNNAIMFALAVKDNRPEGRIAGALANVSGSTYTDANNFGLNLVDDKPMGGYVITALAPFIVGGDTTLNLVSSTDGGQTWAATQGTVSHAESYRLTWARPDATTAPGAFRAIAGTLLVRPFLNKGQDLPSTKDGDIDVEGSATLEVMYL